MSIRVAADHNTQVNNGGSAFTGPVIVGLEDKESFESGDSKPAIFDDHSLAREQLVNIELEQRELEAERKKERQRVVTGMENEDLNALLRALEGQVHNAHICPPPYDSVIPPGLDLQPSPNEEFTVDKLRSNLERFYASVVIGSLRCIREVQRIRGWEEGGIRTVVALLVYAAAWWFNLVITTLLIFLSTLVLYPPSRQFCFGQTRYQLAVKTSSSTGASNPNLNFPIPIGITSRSPSAIATSSENDGPWGPSASEVQAHQWASSMQDLLTSVATGPAPGTGMSNAADKVSEEVNGVMVKDMERRRGMGEGDGGEMSKTDEAIELYGRPFMRLIGGLADKWERNANALNPTPPFIVEPERIKVFLYLLAPMILVSTFVSERLFSRAFGIIFGFTMFGQPIITRILAELDRRNPHWLEKLVLEHNILSNVPTNAQLMLRLLRIAEHERRPLPPSSDPTEPEGNSTAKISGTKEHDVGEGGSHRAARMKEEMKMVTTKVKGGVRAKTRRAWDKIGRAKEEGFALITGHRKVDYNAKTKRALDKINVSHDSTPAKAILKRLDAPVDEDSPDSPSRFYVHHANHGPGHLIIHPPTVPGPSLPGELNSNSSFTPARITFTTIRHVPANLNVSLESETEPSKGHLTISINDVVQIKKEGSSWGKRILTSWLLDTDGAGGTGLEITVIRRRHAGGIGGIGGVEREEDEMVFGKQEKIKLSGIVRRDELFLRLLSLGEQRWEML